MNSLKDYGDLFLRLDLTELSVHEGDFSLVLKREAGRVPQKAEPSGTAENAVLHEEPGKEADGITVKAPLLGIYGELTGERKPVKAGDRVKKGDVLCTIEAMKMLNEVSSPVDGTVIKVCAGNGDLVEYNQTLFIIRE